MNRLDDEYIHLLLDEPIYILADHGDHPTDPLVNDVSLAYTGENRKGIIIFCPGASNEDFSFLFKGLNALGIEKADVAIFDNDYESLKDYPEHTIRLRFAEHIKVAEAFNVKKDEKLTALNSLPLKEISNSQDFKRKFWEALKVIFKENS